MFLPCSSTVNVISLSSSEHLESKVSNIDITEYQPALDYKGNFKNYILSLIKLLDR
jgi:hypothetical protein